jgi:ssDNA-binding replication factor A large subunit
MPAENEMTPDTVIQQILEKKPEIEREQILSRLSVARNMTGGLIADVSLLRMIAAELGVEIASEEGTFTHRLSLGHLVSGLNNATVIGRVVAVYPIKTFEGAKPGKFGSVSIADNDGIVRVILWNEKTSVVESGELKVGQIVKFAHGYTKADKFGSPELHIGERSQVELNPQNIKSEDYPSISKFATKIKQLNLEQKSVHVEGKVKEVFGSSSFTRSDQTPGKVLRIKVGDETGEVTVIFWNEKAEEIESKVKRNAQLVGKSRVLLKTVF